MRLSNLDLITVIEAENSTFTKVRMLGDDLLAIGTANGVVDVWNLTDFKRVMRFLTGSGTVTGITSNQINTRMYVSNSDGSVSSFRLDLDPPPIVPSHGSYFTINHLTGFRIQRWLPYLGGTVKP